MKKHCDLYENVQNDAVIVKKARNMAKDKIEEWINKKTTCKNEFSAIHFACYQGDASIIHLLYKYGADLNSKNKIGLSPMHVAAQNDRAFSLTFLKYHGADVDWILYEAQILPRH